mgnify:CR=1 FL=1
MAPIDFIVIAIIFALLAAALSYAFRRGGRCGGCPSAGSCAAASGGKCPISELTISRIERGLHDMTGTLGGESCGAMVPIDQDGKDDDKSVRVGEPAASDAEEAAEEGVRDGAADSASGE